MRLCPRPIFIFDISLVYVRRIRRHMGATVSNEFTIDQPDTGTRPDSGHSQCTVGLPCN